MRLRSDCRQTIRRVHVDAGLIEARALNPVRGWSGRSEKG